LPTFLFFFAVNNTARNNVEFSSKVVIESSSVDGIQSNAEELQPTVAELKLEVWIRCPRGCWRVKQRRLTLGTVISTLRCDARCGFAATVATSAELIRIKDDRDLAFAAAVAVLHYGRRAARPLRRNGWRSLRRAAISSP